MKDNMLVIREPKTFHFNFDLPKVVEKNFKHDMEFIMKRNESLAEHKIKNEIDQLLLKYKHGHDIYKTENSRTNKPHKFVLNLQQRLGLKETFQKLSIYYTWENIRQHI